jgi:hypothetical protein
MSMILEIKSGEEARSAVSNHEAETSIVAQFGKIARTLPPQRHAVKEYIQISK